MPSLENLLGRDVIAFCCGTARLSHKNPRHVIRGKLNLDEWGRYTVTGSVDATPEVFEWYYVDLPRTEVIPRHA